MNTAEIKQIKQFYENYGQAISNANYKELWHLYAEQGAILTIHGNTLNLTLDSIQSMYATIPTPACDFRFDELHIEALGENAAMVNAIIHWNLKSQTTISRIMYTAILLKTTTGWKIRHEHESPDFETFKNMLKTMEQSKNNKNKTDKTTHHHNQTS